MNKTNLFEHECLMITDKKNNHYFTHQDNINTLIEFCKLFQMNLAHVKVQSLDEISSLPEITSKIHKEEGSDLKFKFIETIIPDLADNPTAKKIKRKTSKAIKESMINRFKKGEVVHKKLLQEEFTDVFITNSTFKRYIDPIKETLESEGYNFTKISPGCYKASKDEPIKFEIDTNFRARLFDLLSRRM